MIHLNLRCKTGINVKPETDEITDDEWLLRRVDATAFRDRKTPLVSPNAFEPRTKGRDIDVTGISLYRLDCLAKPEDILATIPEEKRSLKGIVKIPVALIKSLKLTIVVEEDNRVLGHVVISELNADSYTKDPIAIKPILLQLATSASQPENILLRPSPDTPIESGIKARPEAEPITPSLLEVQDAKPMEENRKEIPKLIGSSINPPTPTPEMESRANARFVYWCFAVILILLLLLLWVFLV